MAQIVLSIHSLIRGWPRSRKQRNAKEILSIHSLIRGWPNIRKQGTAPERLSIHSLIRGWPTAPFAIDTPIYLSIHSLIRGWPMLSLTDGRKVSSFNSQPHTRLTIWKTTRLFHLQIFQFTASYEADHKDFFSTVNAQDLSIHSLIRGWPEQKKTPKESENFQFTASYEADLITTSTTKRSSFFQFTASYEADRPRPGLI